ncbi:cytoplasmic dynein 1 intermediate chain 1-like [Sinocyclocheilus grahami]|uniref:cytoplasmic dynein 1 intermediate chain 1-like n=1 Tax=Sinocyclocheilus grahami TaxID=75366 RepID=UPI0007ACA7BB|nr:PREDICTED: cytoplasmic dynein 1 intermediate chain 1-like [Sinocyclocheilus grahami]
MADRSDLKAELERKKQRLAQIREEKKRKEDERKKKESEMLQRAENVSEDSDLDRKRRETEALLQSIGISPEPPLVPTPMSPSSQSVSPPSETGSQESIDGGTVGRYEICMDSVHGCRMQRLGPSKIVQIDFMPKELVTYSKESQTPVTSDQPEEEEEEELSVTKSESVPQQLEEENSQEAEEDQSRELTNEEKEQIIHSEDFQFFFDRSIRVMERVLAEDTDIFFDYSGRDMEDKEGSAKAYVTVKHTQSPTWCRMQRLGPSKIVQIDFMPKELVTYSKESQTPVASDQPEEEEEEELSVTKSESVPQQLEEENSQEAEEDQSRELTNEEKEQIIHSEDFQFFFDRSIRVMERVLAEDTDIFFDYIGRDMEDKEGSAKAYSKAGIGEMFDGHQGPVTGISCHNAVGPVDFSHLFTTSSFDWTVKLWSTKHNKPLYSFEDNADYVYDVMWSPVHPALFATVDGNGRLDLWNLNNYTEVPSASVTVEGGCALNQVRWASGGREVAVGDSEGHVWIYDVRELAVPHTDDWSKFARTLLEIRANRGDGEEEGALELPA